MDDKPVTEASSVTTESMDVVPAFGTSPLTTAETMDLVPVSATSSSVTAMDVVPVVETTSSASTETMEDVTPVIGASSSISSVVDHNVVPVVAMSLSTTSSTTTEIMDDVTPVIGTSSSVSIVTMGDVIPVTTMDDSHDTPPSDASPSETKEYNIVKEGKADVLFPKSVFYNPVQEFNRDLTIAVISKFGAQKKVDDELKLKAKIERVSKRAKLSNDRTDGSADGIRGLNILEGLAASGLRSVRFALEIPGVNKIVANDYDKNAVEFIEKNIDRNNVTDVMSSSNCDAAMFMYQHRGLKDRFDVVDLDPYGSPSQFLDSSVQTICDGGLLCVTCTDTAVLCGNATETCYSKYGAVSLRAKYCHEMALRILLQCIESHANRYSRYIVPLLSVSVDFYVRVFVKIYTGQAKVKQSFCKLSNVYNCKGCGSFHLQPIGNKTPTAQGQYKYTPATGPVIDKRCTECGSTYLIGGPIWTDPIHDFEFVRSVVEYVSDRTDSFKTSSRIIGVLNVVTEELVDVPLYYVTSALCNVVHCTAPTLINIRSAILNAGYRVSLSHAAENSLKTGAPASVIWDIMRCWVKTHPVKANRLLEGSVTKAILDKEPIHIADFTEYPGANPKSRKDGLVRYQPNPEPEWGPRPRAKRSGNDTGSTDDIIQTTVERRRAKQGYRTSVKREADNTNRKSYPCKRHAQGHCDRGDNCCYSHGDDTTQTVTSLTAEQT